MIKGILFDKDGTLIDFYEVWGKAAVKVAKRLCDARRMPERQRMLLREMGVADDRVDPDGALAWKSYRGIAEDLQEYLGTDPEKLAGELAELFYEEVGLKRAAYPAFTDVKAMMEALRFRGLWIGVATTDDLKSTRRCLEVLGVEEYISFWGVSGEGLPEKPDGRLRFPLKAGTGRPASPRGPDKSGPEPAQQPRPRRFSKGQRSPAADR